MQTGRRVTLSAAAIALFIAACDSAPSSTLERSSACVDIPNGQYFQFVDGQLVGVTTAQLSQRERPPETARRIGATLAGMGYPWVLLDWDGQVATVSGLALDENTRSDAFIAAKSAFEADPVAGPLVERVVNAMSVRDPEAAIAVRLTDELAREGLSWLRVEMVGNVATLIGTAPTQDTKRLAYRTARGRVESDLSAGEIVNIVVDAISIRGDEPPVGATLIGFSADPSFSECEAAYAAIMQAQDVAFISGEAIVENASARLLDTVTGVALLCSNFSLEIAGYAPADTPENSAIDLSQRRAGAVKDYLMAYGADPQQLKARGYGLLESEQSDEPDETMSEPRSIRFVIQAPTN